MPSIGTFLVGTLLCSFTHGFKYHPLELQLPHLRELNQHNTQIASASVSFADHNLSVPVDHFHNESRYEPHSQEYFNLRYWFDASHYEQGGPVFVIAAGETDGTDRFAFLSQGIVSKLAKAYHGIGVILEHRYYGTSYPEGNLTTESIRFLSTEQALADSAYFAQNVRFPGLEHLDLTARSTPWIAYGGSYAGAFVAFLRKLYPEVFFGAVSSSGVTLAVEDYWQYYEPIRQYAPSNCISTIQTFTHILDKFLIEQKNEKAKAKLKSIFGVKDKFLDQDDRWFVSLYSNILGTYQSRNWDPKIGDSSFQKFCSNITNSDLLYPDAVNTEKAVKKLLFAGGYDTKNATLVTNMLNYVGYFNATTFATLSDTSDQAQHVSSESLPKSSYLSWTYQFCTEWGYFQTGDTPSDILPLVSRLIDLPYTSKVCDTYFNITTPPEIDRINKLGGVNYSYPRAAIIDGLADPWREATPHADGAPARLSTDGEPFILVDVPSDKVWDGIRGAVHHWDQNGLSQQDVKEGDTAPNVIVELHKEIVRFVGVWLKQWTQPIQTGYRHRQHVLG